MPTLPKVKICGVNTPEAYRCCADNGADFVGIVQCPSSPRYIDLETARQLLRHSLPGYRPAIVAVCVDADDQQLDDIVSAIAPDAIQCHGKETPERIADIKRQWQRPVIKALSLSHQNDTTQARDYAVADYWLWDAKPAKGAELRGGNAQCFDWSILRDTDWNSLPSRPWFLAGGLHQGNIHEALNISGAQLIDLSSGVEQVRGVKSTAKIAQFLQHLRGA